VNYHEALEAAKYFGEGFFRNKLVFVGVTTNIDEGDAFPIPFTAVGGGMMSGVEIHANAAGNLLYGDYFKRPFKTFIIGVSVLAIIAMAILFFRLRPVKHVILFLGFVVGIFITSLVAFAYQAYLLPVSCLLLPTTGIYLSNLYSYFYGTSGKRNTG
jgi:CHASE2 domain-containing sensor protein